MNWLDLGLIDYQAAWDIQREITSARAAGTAPDTLLLLQHPHTYTLGSSGHVENLLMDEAERQRRGVSVLRVDRGGDITYHGPGQLVAYPILSLGRLQPDGRLPRAQYVDYVRRLEQTIIAALRVCGIEARREDGSIFVEVDGVTFDGIGDVTDVEVRAFLQKIVQEWEARK